MKKIRDNIVTIHFTFAKEIMIFIRELRDIGLIQGIDFDFEIKSYPQRACFYFKRPEHATFYRLKLS
jgi:hypothetical protein